MVAMKPILSLVVVGVLSGTLWAADPWTEKKYTEWSAEEIEKVLRKSPWTKFKTVTLALSYPLRISADVASTDPPDPVQGTFDLSQVPVGPNEVAPIIRYPQTSIPKQPRARRRFAKRSTEQVLVRWQTALPVRQAYTRQQVAAGKMTPEQAEQLVQQIPNQYVVMVSGMPMAAMTHVKVKASSYLKTGRGQRIMAQHVRVSRGHVRMLLIFVFPRAIPIELHHKSVEFVTRIGKIRIKKKFSLKKMVYQGKLEL